MTNDDDDDASFHSRSSYSSSSSSNDGFLTSAGGGRGGGRGSSGNVTPLDREALVRKKLLESFYGASQTPGSANDGHDDDANDDDYGNADNVKESPNERKVGNGTNDAKTLNSALDYNLQSQPQQTILNPSEIPLPFTATKSDLDSPHFHPKSHTLSHIAHSTTQTLLETNERLALDIRTLDSTMQTLVYENYSKFIDATDAIKSIGTNVSSVSGDSINGLDRLRLGMDRIQSASSRSEELLRDSRDAVAEKLRIQRLLTRLDALLSLPQTLRAYIRQSKYRMAVQSHMNATEILGRHSAGFESLRSIELECGSILRELASDLKEKLLKWSEDDSEIRIRGGSIEKNYNSTLDVKVHSPKSIAEIFECARTLLMLNPTPFSPSLEKDQCQSLALVACGRFLRERLVAGHATIITSATGAMSAESYVDPASLDYKHDRDKIVLEGPLTFLDGILESTTLFGVSFEASGQSMSSPYAADHKDAEKELLRKFVVANFDVFISHVRMLLIQKSDPKNSVEDGISLRVRGDEEEESKDDANFRELSIVLSHLLQSVRELASGLALPEVGLDVSVASTLVDQAVELAETMVRRRVLIKFNELRGAVILECLAPLVEKVVDSRKRNDVKTNIRNEETHDEPDNDDSHESDTLVEVIQLASVALSDGLQMADDLIRALLQRSRLASAAVVAPVDSAVVKLAVQKSSKSFGLWLAAVLEQLVGCEPSFQDDFLLDVFDEEIKGENGTLLEEKIIIPQLERDEGNGGDPRLARSSISSTSFLEPTNKDEAFDLLVELLIKLDNGASERAYSDFLLAICEMCRLAQRSMANTLDQSIQSAIEEDARVADSAKTLFGNTINPHRKGKDGLDLDQIMSKRFELAASRSLAMYVMNRGAYAASELCTEMFRLSDARDPYAIPSRPRDVCLNVFEIVKASCEDCISIVGGDLFVAPVAPFPDEMEYVDIFGDYLTGAVCGGGGGSGGATSGLQLDVERMFIEKTQVYPGSLNRLDFTRNSVISGILRVALSALLECVRSSVFSSFGYRQMKVDAVFLRFIIPHYVKDEFGTPEQNACSCLFNTIDNIMRKAGQRCFDHAVINDDDYYDVEKRRDFYAVSIGAEILRGRDDEPSGVLIRYVTNNATTSDVTVSVSFVTTRNNSGFATEG